jgi:hypothetical protein
MSPSHWARRWSLTWSSSFREQRSVDRNQEDKIC